MICRTVQPAQPWHRVVHLTWLTNSLQIAFSKFGHDVVFPSDLSCIPQCMYKVPTFCSLHICGLVQLWCLCWLIVCIEIYSLHISFMWGTVMISRLSTCDSIMESDKPFMYIWWCPVQIWVYVTGEHWLVEWTIVILYYFTLTKEKKEERIYHTWNWWNRWSYGNGEWRQGRWRTRWDDGISLAGMA